VTRDNDLYRQLHITVVEIAAGYPGELRLPGHIGELGLPGHTRELGYPGQISPTTDQPVQPKTKIYSPAGSMNRATGDFEQIKCSYRGELDYPANTL